MERTYIMVKPDGMCGAMCVCVCLNALLTFMTGVQRGLVGEIIKRFENRGYQLMALELIHPTQELLEEHVSILDALTLSLYILIIFL